MDKTLRKEMVKDTFKIAWPAVVESVLVALTGMIDTYMVSGLGKAAVAAIGVTNQPKIFVMTVFFSLNIAISALIARRIGENRKKDANGLFITGLAYTLVLGVLLSILCCVFAEPFMKAAGANPETIGLSTTYFRIIMGCSLFNLISLYFNAAQRGAGNTRIAMTTNLVSNVVNVVMNYCLIQGHLGFPALGGTGAAIATVLGTVVAFIMSTASVMKKDHFLQLQYAVREKIRPTLDYMKELFKLCGTILSENVLNRIGIMVCASLTARIGTAPYSAYLVGMNFLNLGFAFGDGLQSASVALVGKSLGESDPEKAKQYAMIELVMGLQLSLLFSFLLVGSGSWIYGKYFPGDPVMEQYGIRIMRYIAVILPIQVAKIIFSGVLRGAGDVKYALVASTIGVTGIQPVILGALYFSGNLTLDGVFISILISQIATLIMFLTRFMSGKWLGHTI